MTVVMHFGRRVPSSWFRRGVQKVQNVLSFQEHLWTIIKQSLNTAKKKTNSSGKDLTATIITEKEREDLNYVIEWIKVTIRGDKDLELEEFEKSKDFYKGFAKLFKKDMPKDDRLSEHFKSNFLSHEKINEAYEKGYGSISDNNIVNKLLEMGIITHIEYVDDHQTRDIGATN